MRTLEEIEAELSRLDTAREYTMEEWERMQAIRATLNWLLGRRLQSPVDSIDFGFDEAA